MRESKKPGTQDISSYNVDDINDYYDKHSKSLKLKAIQSQLAAAPAPALVAPLRPYSKSEWEQEERLTIGQEEKGTRDPFSSAQG